MSSPARSESLPPRPASHRWVIGFLGFMTFGFVLILTRTLLDKSFGQFLRLPVLFASISVIIVAFFSMCFGGRRRWVYYLTSSLLVYLVARNIQSLYIFGSFWLSPPAGKTPFSIEDMLFHFTAAFLIILLAWRFILGRPSRRYFGFGKSPELADEVAV
jgi:hypothetical protein